MSFSDDDTLDATPRSWWALLVVAVPVVWQMAVLVSIVAARAGYPLDLEWMEGGELYHAHRLIEGQPIYAPPDDGFLPFPYPPAHHVVLAAAGRVVGLDYAMARLISAVCIAGACWLLGREVSRTWSPLPRPLPLAAGLVSVGLVVVAYPDVDGWFDLVRNDSMAIALAVAGAALCSRSPLSWRRAAAAAGVLVLAVMTKQTMALMAAWVAVWVVLFHRRAAPAFVGTLAGAGLACLAALQIVTHGWFWRYAGSSLAGDEVALSGARAGLDLVARAAPYVVAALVLAIVALAREWLSVRTALWLGMLVAAFPAALLPMSKVGGGVNGAVPLLVLAGPVTLMVLADALVAGRSAPDTRRSPAWPAAVLAAGGLFVLVNPIDRGDFVPDADAWRGAERLNEYVADLDGGVLAPSQPFLAARNGHDTPQVHMMGYLDAGDMRGTDLPSFMAWIRAARADERRPGSVPGWHLAELIDREQPRWILLGSPIDHLGPTLGWIPPDYVPAGQVPGGAVPFTGMTVPDEIYERTEPDGR